jgi:hypothetical protein
MTLLPTLVALAVFIVAVLGLICGAGVESGGAIRLHRKHLPNVLDGSR